MSQKLSLLSALTFTILLSISAHPNTEVKSSKPNVFEEAIIQSREKLERNPNDYWAYYRWGLALGHLGRYKEAIEKFKKVAEFQPRFAELYLNWGVALSNLRKYDEALEKFNHVVNNGSAPEVAEAYLNWGIILAKLARHRGAIEKYKKSAEISKTIDCVYPVERLPNLQQNPMTLDTPPRDAAIKSEVSDSYFNCGLALLYSGRFHGAIEEFKKVTEVDPQMADAYLHWGKALSLLNKFDEAIEKYQKTIEIDPHNAEAFFNWGKALYYLDRYKFDREFDRAIEKYIKAVEIDSENIEYQRQLAQAYLLMGKKEESQKVKARIYKLETKK